MLVILKGGCMANTTVNCELIIFIVGIRIKVLKLGILDNNMVNIVPMHTKRSMIFKFL